MSAHETAVGYVESIPAAIAEPELVTALRAGAVEAFNYLIAVYHQPLYRLVYRIVNDPADAADTLQNIFLKVFRGAAHFEGKSSVKTWLYRIAVHEAAHQRRWWRRHKGRETSLELEDEQGTPLGERLTRDEESPLEATLRGERSRRIQRALETVPEPFHTVLLLRELEGFSYDEIADIVEVRVGTVRSRLARGREMLRQALLRDPEACTLLHLTAEEGL